MEPGQWHPSNKHAYYNLNWQIWIMNNRSETSVNHPSPMVDDLACVDNGLCSVVQDECHLQVNPVFGDAAFFVDFDFLVGDPGRFDMPKGFGGAQDALLDGIFEADSGGRFNFRNARDGHIDLLSLADEQTKSTIHIIQKIWLNRTRKGKNS
jgi:hypothetical protein